MVSFKYLQKDFVIFNLATNTAPATIATESGMVEGTNNNNNFFKKNNGKINFIKAITKNYLKFSIKKKSQNLNHNSQF